MQGWAACATPRCCQPLFAAGQPVALPLCPDPITHAPPNAPPNALPQGRYEFLRPKATSLARRVPQADDGLLSLLKCLLQVDPSKRPSAAEALQHPWLQQQYYA